MVAVLPNARGASLPKQLHGPERSVAFARYIASLEDGQPFNQSGPVAVLVEASLPGLYKNGALLAIRKPAENGRAQYGVVRLGGDGLVLSEVVGRYFEIAQQMDSIPARTTAISPANYKFHFAGEVDTGGTSAYIYRISPNKKGQPGLIAGQIWMDPSTGMEVMLTGRFRKLLSIGPAELVRDTKLMNGAPYARITHLAFAVPNLGRAELVVTEYLITSETDTKEIETLSAFAR